MIKLGDYFILLATGLCVTVIAGMVWLHLFNQVMFLPLFVGWVLGTWIGQLFVWLANVDINSEV